MYFFLLADVGYWMNNIRQYSSPHMPAMLLVGNKIDLPNRVVSFEEGQAAANQYNCRFIGELCLTAFMCCPCREERRLTLCSAYLLTETSAKTSENTNGALETIARDAFLMSLNRKWPTAVSLTNCIEQRTHRYVLYFF